MKLCIDKMYLICFNVYIFKKSCISFLQVVIILVLLVGNFEKSGVKFYCLTGKGRFLVFRVIKGVGALETDDLRSGFFLFFLFEKRGEVKNALLPTADVMEM